MPALVLGCGDGGDVGGGGDGGGHGVAVGAGVLLLTGVHTDIYNYFTAITSLQGEYSARTLEKNGRFEQKIGWKWRNLVTYALKETQN